LAFPKEPWITPPLKGGSVFIMNVFSVGAVLGCMEVLTGALLGSTLTLGAKRRRPGHEMAPLMEEAEAPKHVVRSVEVSQFVGVQAQYWKAVAVVSKFAGIAMEPSFTIREYLRLVREKLGLAYASFERLSLLYERWLYSPLRVSEEKSLVERCFKELVGSLEA